MEPLSDSPERRPAVAQGFALERLRESEALFRHLAEHAPVMVWVSDPASRTTFVSRSWYEFTGQSPETALGFGWLDAVHPDDRMDAQASYAHANREQATFRSEYRLRRTDGVYRWMIDAAAPRFAGDGSFLGYVGSVLDIDDRRQAEARQQLLIAELQHRTRNLLALVRSIAAQTQRRSTSLDEFTARFGARLAALSRVQSLLSSGEGAAVSLVDLVAGELGALGAKPDGDRIVIRGPEIELSSKAVQVLALALHELATNAVKHGALAQEQARLEMLWQVPAGQPVLILHWAETGVVLPPHFADTRGFGRQLIEQALPYDLGAETRFAFAPDGVRCEIRLPLDDESPVRA